MTANWVLIIILTIGNGVKISTHDFNTLEECIIVFDAVKEPGTVQAYCIQK